MVVDIVSIVKFGGLGCPLSVLGRDVERRTFLIKHCLYSHLTSLSLIPMTFVCRHKWPHLSIGKEALSSPCDLDGCGSQTRISEPTRRSAIEEYRERRHAKAISRHTSTRIVQTLCCYATQPFRLHHIQDIQPMK